LNRYAFCKDITRVEALVRHKHADQGRSIAVTNDPSYLKRGRPGTLDQMFRLHDGGTLRGLLEWLSLIYHGPRD